MALGASSLPALLRQRQRSPKTRPSDAYSFVYPNRTAYNVETPDCYFRRFTPDGKYLVGFNRNQSGMQVFHVLSASATTRQLVEAGAVPNKGEFGQFFKLAWAQDFADLTKYIHRDLCLITSDSRYMIIVRLRRSDSIANALQQQQQQQQQQQYANNTQLPNMLACVSAMEDMTLLVVELQSGRIADTRTYYNDIVYFSGHNGFSLYEDQLCMVSLKHQCLRILRINPDGRLADIQDIGWYTRVDDAIYEEGLRIREEKLEHERNLARKRKAFAPSQETSGECSGSVPAGAGAKRRRIDMDETIDYALPRRKHYSRTEPCIGGFSGSAAPASIYSTRCKPQPVRPLSAVQLTAAALDPGLPGSLLPSSPHTSQQQHSHASDFHTRDNFGSEMNSRLDGLSSLSSVRSSLRDTIPFIFPATALSQTSAGHTEAIDTNDGTTQPGVDIQPSSPNLTETQSEPMSAAEFLSISAAALEGRASLAQIRALQRLPPQYRLMVTRSIRTIGRLDSLADSDVSTIEHSLTSAPHSGLKQRLLGALFMRAKQEDGYGLALQNFYRSYRQYESLILWRAQFVTRDRLLMRFVPLQLAISRTNSHRQLSISSSSVTNSFSLLAEYDIRDARFTNIWDSSSQSIYNEIESRVDAYRAPMAPSHSIRTRDSRVACGGRQSPSISNDVYVRDAFASAQAAIRNARSGGLVHATRKCSTILPFAAQYTQESPFLDPSRFKTSLRVRQAVEKLRPVSLTPMRFCDRDTGATKFVLSPTPYYYSMTNPSIGNSSSSSSSRQNNGPSTPTIAPTDLQPALSEPSFAGQYQPWQREFNDETLDVYEDDASGTGLVSRSGAVLLPSGGVDELNVLGDSAGSIGQPGTPTLAGINGSNSAAAFTTPYNHKTGVYYLFHPTLPLVVSTPNDMNATSVPVSNIHFWRGD